MLTLCHTAHVHNENSANTDYLSTCCKHIMSARDYSSLSTSQTTGISQWNKQQEINNNLPYLRRINKIYSYATDPCDIDNLQKVDIDSMWQLIPMPESAGLWSFDGAGPSLASYPDAARASFLDGWGTWGIVCFEMSRYDCLTLKSCLVGLTNMSTSESAQTLHLPSNTLKTWRTDSLRRETQLDSPPTANLGHACAPGQEITGARRNAVGW